MNALDAMNRLLTLDERHSAVRTAIAILEDKSLPTRPISDILAEIDDEMRNLRTTLERTTVSA